MRKILPLLAILAAGALPALAQAPSGFSAAAALAAGTSSLTALTGGGTGFAVDGAWDSRGDGVPFRVGLALTRFGGGDHTVADADGDPMAISGPGLTTGQLYAALRTEPARGFRLYLGLSANRHRLTADFEGQGSGQYVKGTKLGARVDLEYALGPRAALVGSFQWVEVGLAASNASMNAPSWFQLGARWSF